MNRSNSVCFMGSVVCCITISGVLIVKKLPLAAKMWRIAGYRYKHRYSLGQITYRFSSVLRRAIRNTPRASSVVFLLRRQQRATPSQDTGSRCWSISSVIAITLSRCCLTIWKPYEVQQPQR